jgi:hypothetical protein
VSCASTIPARYRGAGYDCIPHISAEHSVRGVALYRSVLGRGWHGHGLRRVQYPNLATNRSAIAFTRQCHNDGYHCASNGVQLAINWCTITSCTHSTRSLSMAAPLALRKWPCRVRNDPCTRGIATAFENQVYIDIGIVFGTNGGTDTETVSFGSLETTLTAPTATAGAHLMIQAQACSPNGQFLAVGGTGQGYL